MKKALLVLGFAMCASFAFAQTGNLALPKAACTVTVDGPSAKPVDYKASIFTKDDTVLAQFTFAQNDMDGIIYGASGHVVEGDLVWSADDNGNLTVADTLVPHGQSSSFSNWQRINDSADIFTNATYNSMALWMKQGVADRMGSAITGNDDGYMFMTCRAAIGTGVHNAYFSLRPVSIPSEIAVIDVAFIQAYAKFYDQCYIDYKIGNKWCARAINVEGIDVDINYYASYSVKFTMPLALAGEENAILRFRWFSDGTRSNAYGYFWAVDNVTIIGGEADRWYTNNQSYVDGAYGTMPEGMSIPLTWTGEVFNNGSNARTGVNFTMETLDATRTNSTPLITNSISDIPADPANAVNVTVDERGFLAADPAHPGWWWHGANYMAENISGSYGLRGLPTTEAGLNYVAAHLTSTGAEPAEWDTISYRVVEETGGEGGTPIEGYRWAHDNGIIPSNALYGYGFVQEGNNWYITDTGNYDHEGYTIWLRYTTGNDIPEGTVFRGIEIVPNTVNSIDGIAGTDIFPQLYIGVPADDGESVSFQAVNTGVSTSVPYTVQVSDCNILPNGYIGPEDSYNAVNVRFFAQPELLPNTSYYIGYQMASNGKFSAASTAYRYLNADGSTTSYYRTPAISTLHNQFSPNTYDLYVFDPDRAGSVWAGAYHPYFPLIRPIIGQPAPIPTFNIRGECGTGVTIEDETGDTICGGTTTTYEGGAATVYVYPQGEYNDTATGCYQIRTISVNGSEVNIDNPPAGVYVTEARYDVYTPDSNTLLQTRFYYAVSFSNISQNNVVAATAAWDVFHPVDGIDVASASVSLGLQPNPATSSVKLNVQGVSGQVSCSIIDMSGRVIYSADINAGQPHTIDLSGVAAGAYFVRVVSDKASKIEKLIVR